MGCVFDKSSVLYKVTGLSSWDGIEVVLHGLPQIPGCGWVSLSFFHTLHWPRIGLILSRRERRIFDNCGVILTLIHCFGPPLFTLWSESTLVIWSQGLAKRPYQKNTLSAVRPEPVISIDCEPRLFTNRAILAPALGIKLQFAIYPLRPLSF